MSVQLFPALIGLVDWLEEGSRIGDMNQNGKSELATRLPNAVPSRVVDLDERAVRIFVFEAELLEDFEAAGAALFGGGQFAGDAAGKIRPLTIPACRIVRCAASLPVDVRKNQKAVAVLRPEQAGVLVQQIAP